MRRTSAVAASIHAVEPVSIFTQVSFTCLSHRLGSADFVGCADGFRFRENKGPHVSSVFRGGGGGSPYPSAGEKMQPGGGGGGGRIGGGSGRWGARGGAGGGGPPPPPPWWGGA